MLKEYLVEIRVKDWIHVPKGVSRTIVYEEVLAGDDISARHVGFNQFETRVKYEPATRRIMAQRNLTLADCCAPDCVEI